MNLKPSPRFDHGVHGTPASSYSEQDIVNFRNSHDSYYKWDAKFQSLYANRPSGHVIGPPGISNLKFTLPNQDLDKIIWEWHAHQLSMALVIASAVK